MAADLYVIEPLPAEEAASAQRAFRDAPPLTERLITAGIWLAVAAAALEGVLHFVNAATLRTEHLDVNAEHTIFTWANSCAILACTVAAVLGILFGAPKPRLLLAVALCTAFASIDETVVLHENITLGVLDAVDVGHVYDSVLWPILYLPLLLVTAVLFLRVSDSAVDRGRRCMLVGLGLLAFAVFLEFVSAPWSTGQNAIHTIEGGFEETAELAGWILVATGLASLLAQPFERRSRITRISRP